MVRSYETNRFRYILEMKKNKIRPMKLMKNIKKILIIGMMLSFTTSVQAGNEQRTGQAGATQLLINPFARSSGLAGSNIASVNGVEASFHNVAGLAFTKGTELIFSRTMYLMYGNSESVSNINSFGFAQKMGESSVLSLSFMSMGFGDLEITTEDNPDGGIGTFSPTLSNISLSYAKEFSNSIYGGVTVRMISEKLYNVNSGGTSFDAGIQYVTGTKKHVKFGVSLKNVGPRMIFGGDGLSFRGDAPQGDYFLTVSQRSESFELPSLLNIGLAYDLPFTPKDFRVSTTGAFTSNSFQKDQFRFGLEVSFKELIMLRGGYLYQDGINDNNIEAVMSGPSAGVSVELPMGNSTFGLDYSYRNSNIFQGTHSFGVRITL